MTIQDACEIVDEVKKGYYHSRMVRALAAAVLSTEALKAHGQWRDGEISLNQRLNVRAVCQKAIETLQA